MDPYMTKPSRSWYQRNISALFLLVLLGCGILLFTIILIACSFVVNYGHNYEVSTDGAGSIEEKVQSEFNYTQYWAGMPFLVTGVLVIFSATFQKSRALTASAAIFCAISIWLTAFVISVDGPNWAFWNSQQEIKGYWKRKSGVDCTTVGTGCQCIYSNGTPRAPLDYQCGDITELSSLYGAIVGSAICVALLDIFALLIITKSLSWKRLRRHMYYDRPDVYDNGPYNYGNDYYMDNMDRGPPFSDLPYAKRGPPYYDDRPYPKRGYSANMPMTARPSKRTTYRDQRYSF